ncbi:MAG: UDP-N-acetylmuramyl pentapeptide phosphotransferase [Firmicutes bacterium]|nr:UDP-N-acetylmuramyl pentapeptide phosphotransferase [Bacillota bacterium]
MEGPACGGALLLAALGWLDDRLGSAREKGLRGHLRALFHGRVTTGVWKLAGGGAFALAAAAAARPPRDAASTVAWLADALLVALSINTLNALDLRPGRALKGWLLLVGLAWLLGARSPWLPAFLAAAVGFAPWDLRARAMMGDTGANALGAVAGLAWLAVPDAGARVGVLLALGLFHVWIERRSLTAWIEEHTWARWLDRLGRPPER